MHATASVNGVQVAESDECEVVEGNIYFPPNSLTSSSSFHRTATTTHCPAKGTASYYTVTTNKTEVADAAWFYPDPKPGFENIKGYVAFDKVKADVVGGK